MHELPVVLHVFPLAQRSIHFLAGICVALVFVLVQGTPHAGAYEVTLRGSTLTFDAGAGERNILAVTTPQNDVTSFTRRVGRTFTRELHDSNWVALRDHAARADRVPARCIESRAEADHPVVCPFGSVRRVVVRLADEDDLAVAYFEGGGLPVPMTIYGGAGQDLLFGGDASDRIYTGEDSGWIDRDDSEGLLLADYASGRGGNDKLFGDSGQDILRGARGDDELFGWQGDDNLSGESGNDRVLGGDGDDLLEGNIGIVPQGSQLFPAVADQRLSLVPLCGHGRWRQCRALGRNGALSLGNDIVDGGQGKDTISYAERVDPIRVNLENGSAGGSGESDRLRDVEDIIGGEANDELVGDHAVNNIEGGEGNDTIRLDGDRTADNANCGFGIDDSAFLDFTLDTHFQCEGGLYSGGCEGSTVLASIDTRNPSLGSHRVSGCLINPYHPQSPQL